MPTINDVKKIIRQYWIYFFIIILLSTLGSFYAFNGKNAHSDLIKVTKRERLVLDLPYNELNFQLFRAGKWMDDYMLYRSSQEYLYEMAREMHMENSVNDDVLEHGFECGVKTDQARVMLSNAGTIKFEDNNLNYGFLVTSKKDDLYIEMIISGVSREIVDSLSAAEKAVMLRKLQYCIDLEIKNRIDIIDDLLAILENNDIDKNDFSIQLLTAEKNILLSLEGIDVKLANIEQPEYKENYANKIPSRYWFGAIVAGVIIGVTIDIVVFCVLLRNRRTKHFSNIQA